MHPHAPSPLPRPPRPRTRAVVGWVLYDVANTIFSMGVVSMFFPRWVRSEMGIGKADAVVGFTTAISMGIIFLLSPIVGSMTDRARRRLPFLTVSTLCCVAATPLMGRVGPFGTIVTFAVANIFYQAGQQFYDALLPSVSSAENRGKISGLGVGIGYVGSFFAIGLSLVGPRLKWPIPTLILCISVLFAVFSLPCFLWVDEAENARPGRIWSWVEIRAALARTLRTLRSANEHQGLRRFLLGRLFYVDPVNTVIAMMTLYAINVAQSGGMESARATDVASFVMLGALVFAVLGGIIAGRLVDRLGARKVLWGVLWLWGLTFVLAAALGLAHLPWQLLLVVSALAGVALGGTWAADRPLMLELTPPARLGEFYGLYGMVGRFAAVIGPLIWAICMSTGHALGVDTLEAQGGSILVLLCLIVVSGIILRPLLHQRSP